MLPRVMRSRGVLVLGMAIALAPAAASAQPAPASDGGSAPLARRWHEGLRVRVGVEGVSDVDFGGADLSWARTHARIRLEGRVSERLALGASLAAEHLALDFDGDERFLRAGVASGAPFDDLFQTSLRLGGRVRLGERWTAGALGYLSAKAESGAALDRGLTGGGMFALALRPSDNYDFEASLGISVGSRLDRGPSLSPLLRLNWRIRDKYEIDLDVPHLRFTVDLREDTSAYLFGEYASDRYRLDDRDDGPAGVREGTVRLRGALLGLGLRWQRGRHLRVAGSAGVRVWQQIRIDDADGESFDSATSDGAAPFGSLQVEIRF